MSSSCIAHSFAKPQPIMGRMAWTTVLLSVAWVIWLTQDRQSAMRRPFPILAVWSALTLVGLPLDWYFQGMGVILAWGILTTGTRYAPFRTTFVPMRTRIVYASILLTLGCLAASIARLFS